jgi:hypothetical protein
MVGQELLLLSMVLLLSIQAVVVAVHTVHLLV